MGHPPPFSRTFSRQERLKGVTLIKALFSKGSSAYQYPFRLLFLCQTPADNTVPFPQLLFSVPKKNFKKATDRNLIRRRIREAYRLNKDRLTAFPPGKKKPTAVAVIYIAKEKISFEVLEKKLNLVFARLCQELPDID